MYILFSKLVNMSIYGGVFIIAVLLLRVILKKAPKRFVIFLWALATMRLLVPVNIGSSFSVFTLLNSFSNRDISEGFVEYSNTPEKTELLLPAIESQVSVHLPDLYMPPVVQIWLAGMIAFAAYAIFSYIKLKRKISVSVKEDGVYLCDGIASPFILGIFNPQIYLPSNLNDEIKAMVLSHEKMHIKRLDFIWKPLGFVVLAIHWFNPMVWVGFVMFCRDLELACDEAVISKMEDEEKTKYSEALFACAVKSSGIAPCPVAFGEIGVKKRIETVLKYKKPHIAVIAFAAICVIVCGVCFLTGPISNAKKNLDEAGIPYTDFVGDNSTVSAIVSHMTFPKGYEFDHIELETSEEPYGLTIVLRGSGDKDFDLFSKNADLAFKHIGNLSSVMFLNKDTGELISVANKGINEGTYLPNEVISETNIPGNDKNNDTTYLPQETVTKSFLDNTESDSVVEYNIVDYVYNANEDSESKYSLYLLKHMVMGFYEGYINGDLKTVQSYIAKISSISPSIFEGDPKKTKLLGIVDAEKVVSGESKIMYIAFEDKNNDEGTKKFLELHITKEPDGWKVFGYDTIIEN